MDDKDEAAYIIKCTLGKCQTKYDIIVIIVFEKTVGLTSHNIGKELRKSLSTHLNFSYRCEYYRALPMFIHSILLLRSCCPLVATV